MIQASKLEISKPFPKLLRPEVVREWLGTTVLELVYNIKFIILGYALASSNSQPVTSSLVGPIFSQHVETPGGDYHYSSTNLASINGAIKQQTAVGKDVLGGHSIKHSSQATHTDPLSGSTAVKHNEHEFHINPYYGQAAVHTNNAAGSLHHHIGAAAFQQQVHDAKIAPGHASVADSSATAEVSPLGNSASQDVHLESTDLVPEGVANTAHTAHRSYAEGPLIGGVKKASSATKKSFEGHGYGNLHYNTQAANQAYDPYGHVSANEATYNLNKAYDLRTNLGATNELEYSRHASQDPYGNYGQVTQSKQSSHGGPIVQPHPVAIAYAPPPHVAVAPPHVAVAAPHVPIQAPGVAVAAPPYEYGIHGPDAYAAAAEAAFAPIQYYY